MRLFLGIFPPKEIINSFKDIQNQLSSYSEYLRFVDSSIIHLSVRFLGGDVSEESFTLLKPLLKSEISLCEQFNVRIKEIRFGFPGRRWPRILYVSVMKNEGLNKLMQKVNYTIDSLDLEDIFIDKRIDNPIYHFTVARTKARMTKEIIKNIRKTLDEILLWEGFRVENISLVESVLEKEGPEYKVLEEINLRL